MSERIYKVAFRDVLLTVTYFAKDSLMSMHESPGEVLNKIKEMHRHSEHEVFFVPNGEIKVVFEDDIKSFVNSVVIVPAGMVHYTVLNSDHCFVAYMKVDRDGPQSLFGKMLDASVSYKLDEDDVFYLSALKKSECTYPEDCQYLISLLFSKLIREVLPSGSLPDSAEGTSSKYTFMLDNYIYKHYSEKITLADIASELHLCERQVSRIIKREYKCSFTDFVNIKRLSVAAMMLKHTKMNISDVARSVGYENYNYFYRVFKKKYGVTPAVYRENSKFDET